MKIEVPVWPGWQKPMFDDPRMPVVKAVNIYDHKDGECLGYVFDDVGHVHFAIQLGRAVIACEHIPENYPATTIAFYKCRRDWINAVRSVEWIVNGLRGGCDVFARMSEGVLRTGYCRYQCRGG